MVFVMPSWKLDEINALSVHSPLANSLSVHTKVKTPDRNFARIPNLQIVDWENSY